MAADGDTETARSAIGPDGHPRIVPELRVFKGPTLVVAGFLIVVAGVVFWHIRDEDGLFWQCLAMAAACLATRIVGRTVNPGPSTSPGMAWLYAAYLVFLAGVAFLPLFSPVAVWGAAIGVVVTTAFDDVVSAVRRRRSSSQNH